MDRSWLLSVTLAHSDMGIYAQSSRGGDNPYEKRSEWMEGWNAYGSALSEKCSQISRWLGGLPVGTKEKVEELLVDKRLSLSVGEAGIELYVDCSDLFYWACSDGEDISLDEIPDLIKASEESPAHGDALWACRKRKMRPQKPYYKYFSNEESELFDATGPEREG